MEKINEPQAIIFDEESASDAQKFPAPPKLVILEKKIWQKREKTSKHAENFQKNRKTSERFRMLPSASERVRTHPGRSEQVQTRLRTYENFEKLAKTSRMSRACRRCFVGWKPAWDVI